MPAKYAIKYTTEYFIKMARIVHEDRYDYSKSIYINSWTKVIIICPIHGEFIQIPYSHLHGYGCPKCGRELTRSSLEKVINSFKKIHGNTYDYSRVKYVNAITEVCIVCPIDGDFSQTPHSHLKGQGCPECCRRERMDTQEDFIRKSIEIHGHVYDYSKVIYNGCHIKICIICPIHGEFWQLPIIHLKGCGCQKCNKITLLDGTICDSKAEAYRYLFHKNSGISFIHNQKYGKELGRMRYDFYFPSLNIYEEVTAFDLSRNAAGFNKIIKSSYIERINKKRKYVEEKGSEFRFVHLALSREQYKYLYSNIMFSK